MAINFPDSPSVDEIYSVGDKSWLWNGTYWEVQGSPTSTFSASDTAPASPSAGDIWYRSDTSQTLIYYDSTWVEIGHSSNIANYIADTDADTKIQVEESSDEDTIRFDIAGSEKMALNASSLTVYDSLSVGSGASASSFYASGSGANMMPSGTTAERPASPTAGMFRFNETTGEPEYYHSVAGWLKFRSVPEITVDYLVIAGGGGGENNGHGGGGGGAGGYRSSYSTEPSGGGASSESTLTLAFSTDYTVVVGAGGAGATSGDGTVGSNSTFDSIISYGGGYGGDPAGSGGSGGGARGSSGAGLLVGGSGTAGQGYKGGDSSNDLAASGGGGAGAAGGDSAGGPTGGSGGDGVQSSITGTSTYRAGGGGGATTGSGTDGTGGLGGGGDANSGSGTGESGDANTGGGGGGGDTGLTTAAGSGGSGVVIIRYSASLTPTVSAGLTATTTTVGSDKVTVFTAGTGTVSWV